MTSVSRSGKTPSASPKRQGGGSRSQVGGEQQVVQQLGGLPGSQIAEVHDGVGIGLEHRAAALDDVGVTADHHQQTTFRHRRSASADRRVDNRDTLRASFFRQCVAGLGMHGAVDGDHAARLESGQHPVRAAGDLLDIGVTDHAEADQIAIRPRVRPVTRRPWPPVSANGSSDAGRRAHSVVGKPASTIRPAIGPPWLPKPMNPTCINRPPSRDFHARRHIRRRTPEPSRGSPRRCGRG